MHILAAVDAAEKETKNTVARPSYIAATAAVLRPMAPPQALDLAPAPPPQMPPDLIDAVRFVMTVKREFAGGEPDKYEEFLSVLRESQSMGTAAVVGRMKVLLGGHHDLIRGFNKFVPLGNDINQQQEAATHIRAAL